MYGERNDTLNHGAVFYDQHGNIYPDFFISDTSLANAGSDLHRWYVLHPKEFNILLKRYNCYNTAVNEQSIEALEIAIRSKKVQSFNAASKNKLFVLIHGFRKGFVKNEKDFTSVEEFRLLHQRLGENLTISGKTLDVYWDGMYDCCFSFNRQQNKALFGLFEESYHNAVFVGIGLRKLLTCFDCVEINMIGHSLAARVIQSCMYNVVASNLPELKTPSIHICLIAPATDATSSWDNYLNRSDTADTGNCTWLILYNEKDFALHKKENKVMLFGPGVLSYGSTVLGCNYHKAAYELQDRFKKKNTISLSLVDCTGIGMKHSFRHYINSDYFSEVIRFFE